jgi:hypothetical protein
MGRPVSGGNKYGNLAIKIEKSEICDNTIW